MNNSVAGTVMTPAFSTDFSGQDWSLWLTDEEVVAITGYAPNYLYNLRSRGHLPKSTKFVIDTVDRRGRPIRTPKGFNKAADLRAWLLANGKPEKAATLDAYLASRQGV